MVLTICMIGLNFYRALIVSENGPDSYIVRRVLPIYILEEWAETVILKASIGTPSTGRFKWEPKRDCLSSGVSTGVAHWGGPLFIPALRLLEKNTRDCKGVECPHLFVSPPGWL